MEHSTCKNKYVARLKIDLFQISLLLSLVSVTKCQNNEDAKSRFDKILADFGFSDFNINNLSPEISQNEPVQQTSLSTSRGNQNFGFAPESSPRDISPAKSRVENSGGSPLNNLIDIASGRNRKV